MSEAETVKIDDLVKTDFPTVNKNAVSAVQAAEKPQISTYEVGAGKSFEEQEAEKSGYNPEIHEYPPRKNKHGEWARKRGNKKGFPAKRNAKTETANAGAEPPPLNIPKPETDIAAEKAEAEKAAGIGTHNCGTNKGGGGNGRKYRFLGGKCVFGLQARSRISCGLH